MFIRNGEVLGSVLNSAVPGAKPSKAEEPVDDDSTPEESVVDEVAESAPAPKKAPAKKAAPAFKSVLDDED